MPRKKEYDSVYDMVQYHVSLYYLKLSREPSIRFNEEKHLALCSLVNNLYQDCLLRNPQFDYESGKDLFTDQVDFLTKAYTKKKAKDLAEEKKKALFNSHRI